MGKRQTRHTVSMTAELYASLARWCRSQGVSVAGFVDSAVRDQLKSVGAEMVTREEALGQLRASQDAEQKHADEVASGVFTF